jgi:microtubule-associated protein-like 6
LAIHPGREIVASGS